RVKRTGWRVHLMSYNQGNIGQAEDYGFMQELPEITNQQLPVILIERYQCKPMTAPLEGANSKIRVNKAGTSVTTKDKTSEQFPIHRLPLESTNPSDSFKYLMMRREWRNLVRVRSVQNLSDSSVRG